MSIHFKDISGLSNGAEFFNADLHVHSYGASHDVRDSTMTPEALVDQAVTMGVHILAITDHNNDANTERSILHARQYAGQLLILAGVEITTAHGHLLVYFDPDEAHRLRTLLGRVSILGRPGDANAHTSMSMADVIREAELQGGLCVAAHIDRAGSGFEMLVKGYPNWKRDVLTSPGLRGVEVDDAANLDWYSENDARTGDGAERAKLMLARSQIGGIAGRSNLAHVQGSDAHCLNSFTSGKKGKILTRFKLTELSFDALRTAFSDPGARIRAVATIPPFVPRVRGMHLIGGFLDKQVYHFSDNLNCLIGGRGTGKSTALQSIAYGLGVDDHMQAHDNCPDTVVLYCEDANGISYRYERVRGSAPVVKAKHNDGHVTDVPTDAFRVEYFRQGELAEVAKNPLKHPALFQEFLDRHLMLTDLVGREAELVAILEHNSAELIPLEASASRLPELLKSLTDVNMKILVAEEGKLKEIATEQAQLANEKSLAQSLSDIQTAYTRGLSFAKFVHDYDCCESQVTPLTSDPDCEAARRLIKTAIEEVNGFLGGKQKEIQLRFAQASRDIGTALVNLKGAHSRIDIALNLKLAALRKKGLAGTIAEFQHLLKQKATLAKQIGNIQSQSLQLEELRRDRHKMLLELETVRNQLTQRRKAQLRPVNDNLAATIDDFVVFVRYEPRGIIDVFRDFILDQMQGSYLSEDVATTLCSQITPPRLAELVRTNDVACLSAEAAISTDWSVELCDTLKAYKTLHILEAMWKQPCPVIFIKTRSASPKNLSINQLSDGQKHTILLTIAMLAESNIPLMIDQPEDDLDNAFIFTLVVRVLRNIKERRQVILVTHNANIAVLGDAELLLPVKRDGDCGAVFDRGSVDKVETKKSVLNILEGGSVAFQRRKEIYGY